MLIEGLLGSITGLLGTVVGSIFKYKQMKVQAELQKSEHSHDLAMVKAKSDAMIAKSEANIAITKAQVEGAIDLEDSKTYGETQKEVGKELFSDKWIDRLFTVEGKWKIITFPLASFIATLFSFADFIKSIIRPALTVYLCGISTWITMMAWEIMKSQGTTITSTQAVLIFSDVTSIIIYLTVSAVTFWFGDRQMNKSIMEMNKLNDGNVKDNRPPRKSRLKTGFKK